MSLPVASVRRRQAARGMRRLRRHRRRRMPRPSSPSACTRCSIAARRPAASSPTSRANGFSSARRFGYVRDNFTSAERDGDAARRARHRPRPLLDRRLQGRDPDPRRPAALRRVRRWAAAPIAHNGNLTNALALREELIDARLDLPVGLGHRVHHPPDGALDPEDHPRADEGRAPPRRGRLLDRRDDPLQADRRPRPARRPPADARPRRRRAGCSRPRPAPSTSSAPTSSARSSPARW